MPIKVEGLPGEPIIVVTMSGRYDGDSILDMYRQIVELADPWPPPVFTIYVVDKLKWSWGQVLAGLNQTFKKTPGSPSDPRLRTVAVGTSDVVQTVAKAAGKDIWGGAKLRVFSTLDEALNRVRARLARPTG